MTTILLFFRRIVSDDFVFLILTFCIIDLVAGKTLRRRKKVVNRKMKENYLGFESWYRRRLRCFTFSLLLT